MTIPDGTDPSSADFFQRKYLEHADPWNFAESAYELSRYGAIMAALSERRYHHAFEPGCSVGVLTQKLAEICDRVEAIDFAAAAVANARARGTKANVTFGVMNLPDRLPLHGFDLIVLSEVGYYFSPEQWTGMVSSMVATAAPGTTFLAAHWLGTSQDHRMSGDQVHDVLRAHPGLLLTHEERHPGFRLDRWERRA